MTKYLFVRCLFLFILYLPLGALMIKGRPARLQGLLYDVEKFLGLNTVAITLFVIACVAIALEAIVRFVNKESAKGFVNIILLILFSALAFYSVKNDVFYKETKAATRVEHDTLIVTTEGAIYNINLDINKIAWEYVNNLDSSGNRNQFVLHEQNIIIPFESGSLINFDVNTGDIIWREQIYGKKNTGIRIGSANNIIDVKGLTPLFMSKPFVDNKNVVIASHGQPSTTTPFLYSFDRLTGKMNWQKKLPTHFNLFSPVKYKGKKFDYYFVNSAVYLKMHGANSGSNIFYGADGNAKFDQPTYSQMQTDRKNLFIGDENGNLYALALDKEATVLGASDTNNSLTKNSPLFKWFFSEEGFSFQKNGITFLDNKVLYTDIQNGQASKSGLFAIKSNNGELEWKKTIDGSIQNWALIDNRIIGYTEETIFYLDKTGENYTEIEAPNKILSNIEALDKDRFIYITQQGIEILNLTTKETLVVLEKPFNDNLHNDVQIKFIPQSFNKK